MNHDPAEAARSNGARGLFVRGRLAALAVVVAVLTVGGVAAFLLLSRSDSETSGPPSAVIIDQLSLTSPNPGFVTQATAQLESAGYHVDYVAGEAVTVDLFRTLPKRGYDIVLVRAHAGRRAGEGGVTADIFTAEPYSSASHAAEQRAGTLKLGAYSEGASLQDAVFTIPAEFVEKEMRGGFAGAIVVLMGCDVLGGERLAASFVDRGASSVVGWDQTVSAPHTDAATLSLLRHLLQDRLPVAAATAAAMRDVGPDPYYGSKLVSYPK
jgi:hypothetical protein